MSRCLAAFTETDYGPNYPGYVSVNREDDGTVTVTVRERTRDGMKSATLRMADTDAVAFSNALHVSLAERGP